MKLEVDLFCSPLSKNIILSHPDSLFRPQGSGELSNLERRKEFLRDRSRNQSVIAKEPDNQREKSIQNEIAIISISVKTSTFGSARKRKFYFNQTSGIIREQVMYKIRD